MTDKWHFWPDEKPTMNGAYLVQEPLERGAEMYVAEYWEEEPAGWEWRLLDGDGVFVAAWRELPRGIYSSEEIAEHFRKWHEENAGKPVKDD